MTDQDNATSTPTSEAVAGLFRAAVGVPARIAPEREGVLGELFSDGPWSLSCVGGAANFYAVVPDRKVSLTTAGLAGLWNIAFVAFIIADAGTRARAQEQVTRKAGAPAPAEHDLSALWCDQKLGERLAYAEQLFSEDRPWPSAIPLPPAHASKAAGSDRKVLDLFLGALGWLMLHEIGHIALDHEVVVPASQRVTQEHEADEFATKWVLGGAGHGLKLEFRIMAVSTAMAYVLLNQRKKGIGSTHPPGIQRVRRAIEEFSVGSRSVGLESAAYFLKAIFDPATSQPQPEGPEEAFEWVVKRLCEIFPGS